MAEPSELDRLSNIQTLWTVVCQAGGNVRTDEVNAAQAKLVEAFQQQLGAVLRS